MQLTSALLYIYLIFSNFLMTNYKATSRQCYRGLPLVLCCALALVATVPLNAATSTCNDGAGNDNWCGDPPKDDGDSATFGNDPAGTGIQDEDVVLDNDTKSGSLFSRAPFPVHSLRYFYAKITVQL